MDGVMGRCVLGEGEVLAYRTIGRGQRKLVLLHGLAARSETWADLVQYFPQDRYTLYLLDLLGSGESAKPARADYSIRAHGRRVLRFLERQGLTEVTLAGHSLGGAIALLAAMEAANDESSSIASLVVMAGPGFIQRLPLMARVFSYPLTGPLFVALPTPDEWIRVGLRAAYFDQQLVDQEHVDRYAPCYRDRDAKRALVATCRQMVPPDCDEIVACYEKLRLPVLLLWGRHDRVVRLSQGERLYDAIAGARLEIIEDCGHNLQEERPAEVFRIIDDFIGTVR